MALSADVIYETASPIVQAVPALNGDICYAGALIAIDGDGYAAPWADTAGYVFAGLAMRQVTGDTSASPVPECEINTSGPILKKVAVTGSTGQTDVGVLVFATDDNSLELGLTPTNVKAVGRVSRWYSGTTCDVQLFTPAEYLALN
tara:strand:- start:3383 stop:3820 length:438 start_codon:yes stop_codon:yes gene_type:complete